jgi:aconitate hydratase
VPFLFADDGDYEKVEKGDRLVIEDALQMLRGNQSYSVLNQTKHNSFRVSTNLNDREKEIILAGGLLPNTKKRARLI